MSKDGVKCDPEKIRSVQDWKCLLGLASYYRKFIPDFATVVSPLHKLTTKNATFVWDDKCEEPFYTLKKLLVTTPILNSYLTPMPQMMA